MKTKTKTKNTLRKSTFNFILELSYENFDI